MATLVGIIIAVVVLVVVIYGFTSGWNNIWGKITNIGNVGEDNTGEMKVACQNLCTANDNNFCTSKKTLISKGTYPDGDKEITYTASGKFSCNEMSDTTIYVIKRKDGSYYLSSEISPIGSQGIGTSKVKELKIEIDDCQNVNCKEVEADLVVSVTDSLFSLKDKDLSYNGKVTGVYGKQKVGGVNNINDYEIYYLGVSSGYKEEKIGFFNGNGVITVSEGFSEYRLSNVPSSISTFGSLAKEYKLEFDSNGKATGGIVKIQ